MNRPIATETEATSPSQPEPSTQRQSEGPLSFPALLDRMTSAERLRAYRSGAFDAHECSVWALHYPEEPPVVNGELEWIALSLADLD